MNTPYVPYANLKADAAEIKKELLASVEKVLDSGMYILGPQVESFEKAFATYCGSSYAVGVDNGTSALILLLKAMGVGIGDEVITSPNSFLASASSIALIGAKPVFVDISPDLNLNPELVEAAITPRTKAIMVVHLTGRPAKIDQILTIAEKHGIPVIEDAAQSVGAKYKGQKVGGLGAGAAFSLHPLKNLHAFGDAGIITIHDKERYDWLKIARNHGLRNRTDCDFFSHNTRLDEMHAAMLNVQLAHLDKWTEMRRKRAFRYNEALKDLVKVPTEGKDEYCVYQTYVVRASRRDELNTFLNNQGVEGRIHYPISIPQQKAASYLEYQASDLPETTLACQEILSLPLYHSMSDESQDYVISLIQKFYAS